MIEISAALIPLLLSAIVAGLFGALKYYSNILGSNPETFELGKFIPILIISIILSIGFVLSGGSTGTAEEISKFISANFLLVMFANTVWTIILKKYPCIAEMLNITTL